LPKPFPCQTGKHREKIELGLKITWVNIEKSLKSVTCNPVPGPFSHTWQGNKIPCQRLGRELAGNSEKWPLQRRETRARALATIAIGGTKTRQID